MRRHARRQGADERVSAQAGNSREAGAQEADAQALLRGLANLCEIVIDPERCPLTLAEFSEKEYLCDRDGVWLDEIPDEDDHSIDAVRYAMTEDVLRGA